MTRRTLQFKRPRRTAALLLFVLSSVHAFCTPTNQGMLPILPSTATTKTTTKPFRLASVSSQAEIEDSFEINIGRALDILRHDYPNLLTDDPDYSIYSNTIEIIDPSGVKVHGLRNYKAAFNLIHALIRVLYCEKRMTLKLCFDKARQNVRIHWNVAVCPRFGNQNKNNMHHVDGISVYEFDKESGKIVQHRIENLLYNDTPVQPKEGVIALLRREHRVTVPSYCQSPQTQTTSTMVQFQFHPHSSENKSQLFAVDATKDDLHGSSSVDWDALERKNQSRQKFGLKPLTPEEFMELQQQVAQIAEQTQQQQQQQAKQQQQQSGAPNFLDQLFGKMNDAMTDTCESNWDCQRPMVCCDFGFVKRCCSSGNLVGNNGLEYATVPVPQGIEDVPPRRRSTN